MSDIVSPARTRVLLALVAVYERNGRATVRSVAEAADKSPSTTATTLLHLRELGLAEWTPRQMGTLRPTVAPTRTGVRSGGRGSTTIGAELNDPGGAPTPRGQADVQTLDEEPST